MTRFCLIILLLLCAPATGTAQTANPEVQRFRALAARIVDQRLNALEEDEKQQQQAMDLLEAFATRKLGGPSATALQNANEALAQLVTQHPAVGESYVLVPVQPTGKVIALVANFSLSGPAAIRLYVIPPGGTPGTPSAASVLPRRVARIDRFASADFFDESVDLVPLASPLAASPGTGSATDNANQVLFLTVSGRTDELQTGAFTVWRWRESGLERLWESELLQQSSYQTAGGELTLTFCAEPDERQPRVCQRMVREKYGLRGGVWNRLEQTDVPLENPQRESTDFP